MKAQPPSLAPAIEALDRLAASGKLSGDSAAIAALAESRRRLERMANEAPRLIELNNQLVDSMGLQMSFDPETETITFGFGENTTTLRLSRANPDVPVSPRHMTSGGAYDATADGARSEERAAVMREMETGLEAFYTTAHRVQKLLQGLPGLKTFECRPITIVRNKLVEHPPSGSLYSFGFGSSGPRVKPMNRGKPEWNDEGLVPNTDAFTRAIVGAVDKVLSAAT